MAPRPFAVGAGGGSIAGVLLSQALHWALSPARDPVNAGPASEPIICHPALYDLRELLAVLVSRVAGQPTLVGGLVVAGGAALLVGFVIFGAGVATGLAIRRVSVVSSRGGGSRLEGYRCPP